MPADPNFTAKLIKAITERRVIPVIGPGAVLVRDQETGLDHCFYEWLAPRLAERLDLPTADRQGTLNEVVFTYLADPRALRSECYHHIHSLIEEASLAPAQPLLDLAAITDFQFYISTTFDPFLRDALSLNRSLFNPAERVVAPEGTPDHQSASTIAFHPTKIIRLPEDACPRAPEDRPYLYQAMGNLQCPDYALWEEDQMEFICEMQKHVGELQSIFQLLGDQNTSLLLIGTPFSDLIVRFFLRVIKQGRLSQRIQMVPDGVADDGMNFSDSMVQYFDHLVTSTSLIRQSPAGFITTLRQQWEQKVAATKERNIVANPPMATPAPPGQRDIPDGSFFLSYAREDKEAAERIYEALTKKGLNVFLDRIRLQVGGNFESNLKDAVHRQCGYFISFISNVTIHTTEAYYHKERRWAAERAESHPDETVFYLPVVIDEDIEPKLEPSRFSNIHYDLLPGGAPTQDFIDRLKLLQDYFQEHRQPPIGI